MKLWLISVPIGLLCSAMPASGQHVRGGFMAGPSQPVSEARLDTGLGGEGWVGVEFPDMSLMPRAVVGIERFSGKQQSRLDMKSARIDVLGILRDVPLQPFGFAGVGVADTEYSSSSDELPFGAGDAGMIYGGGIGARQDVGPVQVTAEARYFIISDADLNEIQLRLGVGF